MKDMLIEFSEEMACGDFDKADEIMERTMNGEYKTEFREFIERSLVA